MLLSALCLAFLAIATGAQKVNPPPGPPGNRIYLDLDGVAEYGESSACDLVQSQRRLCYTKGQASGKLADEWNCLCADITAEAAAQCFAYSYSKMTNTTEKSLFYQSYLFYTYDCYCGVTKRDVSFNETTNQPWVPGLNGTLILPPDQGCPAPPSDGPSKPPCGCKPPRPPCDWKHCPAGQRAVNGQCVPDCTLPPSCDPPRKLVGKNCECVWPNVLDKNGNCGPPPCPPAQVRGCDGCVCPRGKEFGATTDVCVDICPENTRRTTPGGPCEERKCPRPAPWETTCGGQCYCPAPYIVDSSGNCVDPPPAPCPAPKLRDPVNPGYCYCPFPYSRNSETGECDLPPPGPVCDAPWKPSPWEPWTCYCPAPNYIDEYGQCVERRCVPPEVLDANEPICRCPSGHLYNAQGLCVPIGCEYPATPDPYDPLNCICTYPWTGTNICKCEAPNVESEGNCAPPPLAAPSDEIPTIEALPPPNDTTIPPEISSYPSIVSESYLPSTESYPVTTDYSSSLPEYSVPTESEAYSTEAYPTSDAYYSSEVYYPTETYTYTSEAPVETTDNYVPSNNVPEVYSTEPIVETPTETGTPVVDSPPEALPSQDYVPYSV